MITSCKYCGIEVEVDVDHFDNGDELQTTCPNCGRDFDFIVVKDEAQKGTDSGFYFLDDNNEQKGPYPLETLTTMIDGSTLVWKEGMTNWEKACDIAELRTLVNTSSMISTPPPPPPSPIKVIETPQPEEQNIQPIKPDTNMLMAILCTLFCCIPLGVIAIVYAARVDKLYYQGDYFEAEECSEKAKTWTYWGIGLGIAFDLIYFMIR